MTSLTVTPAKKYFCVFHGPFVFQNLPTGIDVLVPDISSIDNFKHSRHWRDGKIADAALQPLPFGEINIPKLGDYTGARAKFDPADAISLPWSAPALNYAKHAVLKLPRPESILSARRRPIANPETYVAGTPGNTITTQRPAVGHQHSSRVQVLIYQGDLTAAQQEQYLHFYLEPQDARSAMGVATNYLHDLSAVEQMFPPPFSILVTVNASWRAQATMSKTDCHPVAGAFDTGQLLSLYESGGGGDITFASGGGEGVHCDSTICHC